MLSSHLIICHPLLLLPPIPPSIRVFSNESTLCMRWPKYWSFSFSISPSNEHPELIFRMDWLDLLAVQGTLKSLLQHHSSKASILLCSAFFIVQLLHPYMTTGKTTALTRWTFVGCIELLHLWLQRIYQSDFDINHLVMSMFTVFSCVVGRGCLLWPVHSLGKTLLAFALLHFVLQGQICLLLQISFDFLILHSSTL